MIKRLFPLIFILMACHNQAQQPGELSPDMYEKAIQRQGIQLLDVRTAGEYQSGHLKGALQADWTDKNQFADRTQYLDKLKPVYVYCLSGGRSRAAAEYLRANGFRDVTNLTGGISAWKLAGKEVQGETEDKPQTTRKEFNAMLTSAPVVIVDFGAEWCPPCKKMEPVLEAYMKNKSSSLVALVKMDGGKEISLMKEIKVEALPTFILYRKGSEEKRFQGVMTEAAFEKWVGL